MDDDQLLHLAIAVTRIPGVYALLLGSGVSRSAGIPTGWEIMEDLIRQLAGQTKLDDPFQWYLDKYGHEPTYDKLVSKFGRKSFERNALLRPYFEPTDEERRLDIKCPQPAHYAVAQLVKDGFIRVILTTNFDRLLETALAEMGVTPDVIITADGIKGARPLQHSPITIIKLHGDYLDGRIKNTATELAKYEKPLDRLLDRVLDEYGLIVCGWSAEWDEALRNAFYRAPNRRYSTYWAQFGELKEDAKRLTDHRDAEIIPTSGANSFFDGLEQRVTAIQATKRQSPLSIPIAVEQVKRMLPNSEAQVQLEDFIRQQVHLAHQRITSKAIIQHLQNNDLDADQYVEMYYQEIELVVHVFANLCWYGEGKHSHLIADTISQWIDIPEGLPNRSKAYIPALILIYSVGIASLKKEAWSYIQAALCDPQLPNQAQIPYKETELSFLDTIVEALLKLTNYQSADTSLSEFLYNTLKSVFQSLFISQGQYDNTFDLFEVILSVLYVAETKDKHRDEWIPPHIALHYTNRSWDYIKDFWYRGGKLSSKWGFLSIEPFEGKTAQLEKYLELYVKRGRSHQDRKSDLGQLPDYLEIYGKTRTKWTVQETISRYA